MPADQTPSSGQDGILWNGAMIPVSAPLSYVPCKGEAGITAGGTFLPLEPLNNIIRADDMPIITTAVPIDREAPWTDQVDMRVATPCIAPYDWSLAAALVLDTTPDASATPTEKALPGYVANPGLMLSSRTMWDFDTETTVAAINIDNGKTYKILTVGTTDFVALFGASANTVGVTFVATAAGTAGSGTGTTTHLAGAYNDQDGIGFRWTYATTGGTPATPHPGLRAGQTRYTFTNTAGSFIIGRSYKIKVVGTTDFTLIGSANNTVGTVFTATGVGTGTGTADDQTITANGTVFDGTPFIPSPLTNGSIKISAFRYGLLLSDVATYTVKVKIGRAKATWDATAQTLTLEATQTAGTTIKYTLNAGALTTYSAPISIADTGTVVWYSEKTNLVTSDTWTTIVTYADAAPPDNFETIYFSTLPAIGADQNTTANVALQFQRKPDWYISPAGTGDGLTPSTPSNFASIIGISSVLTGSLIVGNVYKILILGTTDFTLLGAASNTVGVFFTATGTGSIDTYGEAQLIGKAYGPRTITATLSGTANLALTRTGANPSGSLMKYSEDGTTFSTYSAAITPAAPGRVWFKLVRADASDFTRRFSQPWFIGTGTGVQINAVWSLAGQTLTLTYEPTPLEAADVAILYSLDGSTPSLPYTGPIAIVADCTPKVKAIHTAREPHDFSTSTGAYTCSAIVIASTPDYDEDHAATWTADATVSDQVHTQGGDLAWCSEGTYTGPSWARGYTATPPFFFPSATEIYIRGGYSSDFSERDVNQRKSVIKSGEQSSGIFTVSNIQLNDYCTLDGFYGEPKTIGASTAASNGDVVIVFRGFSSALTTTFYNCHINYSIDATPSGRANLLAFIDTKMVNCTVSLNFTDSGGGRSVTIGRNSMVTAGTAINSSFDIQFPSPTLSGAIAGVGLAQTATNCQYNVSVDAGSVTSGASLTPSITIGDLTNCVADLTVICGTTLWGSYARIDAVVENGNTINADIIAGDCTNGGSRSLFNATGNAGYKNTIDVNCTSGAGAAGYNNSAAAIFFQSSTGSYAPKVTGSVVCASGESTKAYVVWPAFPVYFAPGDVAITEGAPYGAGNPVRVDHAAGSTTGWYSGMDAGQGAPLKGYETPAGAAIALGKFWE